MILIRKKNLTVPIIQGGMGVGISLGNLAGAVAARGGMGVISTINPGYNEPDFIQNPNAANCRALTREIKKAKAIAKGCGMVAINAMVATASFADCVKTAIEAGVDAVVSGAGLPANLPALATGKDVALAPIVSSGRAAGLICKLWKKHHNRTPDFIVIEGPESGGHLGFSRKTLTQSPPKLDTLLADVLAVTTGISAPNGGAVPVFIGGGVFDATDVAHYISQGAAGVQIGTRFIATRECDASQGYKDQIIAAKASDAVLIDSPVGMPGRALNTPLIQAVSGGTRFPAQNCIRCLTTCHPAKTPYCISNALIEAVRGHRETGLFFCGSNVGRINRMTTVPKLIDELCQEWRNTQ